MATINDSMLKKLLQDLRNGFNKNRSKIDNASSLGKAFDEATKLKGHALAQMLGAISLQLNMSKGGNVVLAGINDTSYGDIISDLMELQRFNTGNSRLPFSKTKTYREMLGNSKLPNIASGGLFLGTKADKKNVRKDVERGMVKYSNTQRILASLGKQPLDQREIGFNRLILNRLEKNQKLSEDEINFLNESIEKMQSAIGDLADAGGDFQVRLGDLLTEYNRLLKDGNYTFETKLEVVEDLQNLFNKHIKAKTGYAADFKKLNLSLLNEKDLPKLTELIDKVYRRTGNLLINENVEEFSKVMQNSFVSKEEMQNVLSAKADLQNKGFIAALKGKAGDVDKGMMGKSIADAMFGMIGLAGVNQSFNLTGKAGAGLGWLKDRLKNKYAEKRALTVGEREANFAETPQIAITSGEAIKALPTHTETSMMATASVAKGKLDVDKEIAEAQQELIRLQTEQGEKLEGLVNETKKQNKKVNAEVAKSKREANRKSKLPQTKQQKDNDSILGDYAQYKMADKLLPQMAKVLPFLGTAGVVLGVLGASAGAAALALKYVFKPAHENRTAENKGDVWAINRNANVKEKSTRWDEKSGKWVDVDPNKNKDLIPKSTWDKMDAKGKETYANSYMVNKGKPFVKGTPSTDKIAHMERLYAEQITEALAPPKALPPNAKKPGSYIAKKPIGTSTDSAPVNQALISDWAAKIHAEEGGIKGLSSAQTEALLANIGHTESGGIYTKVQEKLGYLGKYQFGASALMGLGLIRKDKFDAYTGRFGKRWTSTSHHKDFLEDDNNWIAGWNQSRFLGDKETQERFIIRFTNGNLKQGTRAGVISETSDAAQIGGFAKASHLGGAGGAIKYARTGKTSSDYLGTSTGKYWGQGASSVTSGVQVLAVSTTPAMAINTAIPMAQTTNVSGKVNKGDMDWDNPVMTGGKASFPASAQTMAGSRKALKILAENKKEASRSNVASMQPPPSQAPQANTNIVPIKDKVDDPIINALAYLNDLGRI